MKRAKQLTHRRTQLCGNCSEINRIRASPAFRSFFLNTKSPWGKLTEQMPVCTRISGGRLGVLAGEN